MTRRDIVGRISNQPAVGHVAHENGMVRTPNSALQDVTAAVVDLSANQRSVLDKQFTYLADRLAELDTLRKGVVMLIDRVKVLEDLAKTQNDRITALKDAEEGSYRKFAVLAEADAELNGRLTELLGDLAVAQALKEVNEHDAQKRAEFDRQHPTDDSLPY